MFRQPLIKLGFLAGILLLAVNPATAQFYNGLSMNFGKNRIQYPRGDILESEFFASFYRHDRFDVYFYPNGRELAEYVSRFAFREINRLENFLEYTLDKRIIFIVYNKLSAYRQSNIGLISGREETNIGGVTKILDNKVFLYFEGDYRKFDQQILSAIAEVIFTEMLYGGNVRDRMTSSALLNLPDWYTKGLFAFLSKGWDIETENRVKDGILSGKYKKFNRLEGQDAVYAGQSIWYFISESFGRSVIPTIIYFTRINRSASAGFLNVLGTSLNALSYEWQHFYKTRFAEPAHQGSLPEYPQLKIRNRKGTEYLRARISPDGRYIAYASNSEGQIRVFLHDEQTGKSKKIYQTGAKLGQIEDLTFPVLSWHPTGQLLSMIMDFKGVVRLSLFPLETGKWEHQLIENYDKILDFSYSDDGLNLVLSAVLNGHTDIFVYNLMANTSERITDDEAGDFNPRFIDHSRKILFLSNRADLSLEGQKESRKVSLVNGMFVYDYTNKSDLLTRIDEPGFSERMEPYHPVDGNYYYLGDDNGILNRYQAQYDSTVIAIDTTVHYSFYSVTRPLTHYSRNILDHSVSPEGDLSELLYVNGKYQLFRGLIPGNPLADGGLESTSYRKKLNRDLEQADSLKHLPAQSPVITPTPPRRLALLGQDSAKPSNQEINVNNYLFESEKALNRDMSRRAQGSAAKTKDPLTGREFYLPAVRIYQPRFYINYLASQVDFTFLNASYQAFTGGAPYYNPGFNMLFKVGTQDLFEDYKLVAGVRFGTDFNSNEYLLSFENLKKRLDKEIIFHRQVYQAYTDDYSVVKAATQELFFILKYPFSQVSSIRGTFNGRIDDYQFMSTDQQNLIRDGITKFWAGTKLEYVFDNTRMITLNLFEGMRYKVFGEYYQQVNGNWSDVFILGADFRHYLPLHRSLIWANRLAGSTSFGGSRLIYYMGGVDNWMYLSRTGSAFDGSNPIDTTQNFVYQALATNMRGFHQNIRNGNNFIVFNTELRWPVFRYFANKPLNSDFLNNFQVIGFFDFGSAWSGPTPWSKRNHLNRKIIENGPFYIVIDQGNHPFVAGYGVGVRSRLLGYFVRLDYAWGVENYEIQPGICYLSLSLDF